MQKTYYIVPSTKSYYDTVESDSKEHALVNFATGMTDDMSAYFEATDTPPDSYPHGYEYADGDYETAMSVITASLITQDTKSQYYNKDFDYNDADLRHMDAIIRLQMAYDGTIRSLRNGNTADAQKICETKTDFYRILQHLTEFEFDEDSED